MTYEYKSHCLHYDETISWIIYYLSVYQEQADNVMIDIFASIQQGVS